MSSNDPHRDGWLPLLLVAALLMLVLQSGPASSAVGEGHAGGHVGEFAGGSREGGGFPRGRQFGGRRFDGRRIPHGPRAFIFPYFDDPYYGYDPYYPYDSDCDPYSPSYAPEYCYSDDGP